MRLHFESKASVFLYLCSWIYFIDNSPENCICLVWGQVRGLVKFSVQKGVKVVLNFKAEYIVSGSSIWKCSGPYPSLLKVQIRIRSEHPVPDLKSLQNLVQSIFFGFDYFLRIRIRSFGLGTTQTRNSGRICHFRLWNFSCLFSALWIKLFWFSYFFHQIYFVWTTAKISPIINFFYVRSFDYMHSYCSFKGCGSEWCWPGSGSDLQ